MTNEARSPRYAETLAENPALVAEMQAELGHDWAEHYRHNPQDRGAEIILRNPAVYLGDVNRNLLPEGLQGGWINLLKFANVTAEVADTKPDGHDWAEGVNGVEKIQWLVNGGFVAPHYANAVEQVIREASDLFDASTREQPGNTKYYAGNVIAAQGWLAQRQD